jgi:hypothetical protein
MRVKILGYCTELPNCTILDPRLREDDNSVGHIVIRKAIQLNHSWFAVFTGTPWVLAFARMTAREEVPS